MEFTMDQLTRTSLQAVDGEIGYCKDLMFDEQKWVVRYLVADTHKWIPFGQKVVISPIAIDEKHWDPEQSIPVRMTKEQIKESPPLSSHLPISREYEIKLFRYYGYGYYWMGPGLWGTSPHPAPLINAVQTEEVDFDDRRSTGLRSMQEIKGYQVKAADGVLGQVSDFVLDDADWVIKSIDVSSREVLPGGKHFTVPASWITKIDWLDKSVFVDKALNQLKS